ncbi:MAG: hypothetical protein H0T70_10295 [Acidimicrobiia bacterium]|nr:hypothetical protein [Acidimicrobiia bacterium]
MSGKRQRTTFAKNQRERARMDKAAEKRARRLARKQGEDVDEAIGETPDGLLEPPPDPDEAESE